MNYKKYGVVILWMSLIHMPNSAVQQYETEGLVTCKNIFALSENYSH